MSRWKAIFGTIALTAALAATASPSIANERHARGDQEWRNARAQAIPDSDISMSGERASALRQCNDQVSKMKEYTWGEQRDLKYSACMAQHGEVE
jgi:hypothetical protein